MKFQGHLGIVSFFSLSSRMRNEFLVSPNFGICLSSPSLPLCILYPFLPSFLSLAPFPNKFKNHHPNAWFINSLTFVWNEARKHPELDFYLHAPTHLLLFRSSFMLLLHVKSLLPWKAICRFVFFRGIHESFPSKHLSSLEYVSHFAYLGSGLTLSCNMAIHSLNSSNT